MGLRRWRLAGRLRLALGAFVLLLTVGVVVIVVVLRQADRAVADQTQRIFPARLAASQLLTSLVDQETGLRGFAITHDDAYLAPYRDGLRNEARFRERLGRYLAEDNAAQLDLVTVDAAITAWQQEYAALRLKDIRTGSGLTSIQFGRDLFDQVRASNAALDTALAGEARRAQSRADRDRRLVAWALAVTALVVALALLGLQRSLRSVVLRPLEAVARQVAIVARGDHDQPIVPSGPPDLQEMGASVESMRQELVQVLQEVQVAQRDLERRAGELARSNADLEQFAYVASHDLQEPLRKVASFCQLLEQRYGGQLDERGEQYIAFAVDGAKRMQGLITDLLTFSRVGRSSEGLAPVDLGAVVRSAWADLEVGASETGAQLDVEGELPRVSGDRALLTMLCANLLGNAVKYRRPDAAPRILVSSRIDGHQARVDVADNGIGIPDEYAEKVFVIFQRLHGRDAYEGTGIGLALCKRIVEFHGGSIGLRPSPLGGTCVSFTLPLEENPARD